MTFEAAVLVVAAALVAAPPQAPPPPPAPLVVLTTTGAVVDGLPVLAPHPDAQRYLDVLSRGFSGRLLRLYALTQEFQRRATGRIPEPAYLALTGETGGFPRVGFVIDGTRKPDAGWVDLRRTSAISGRYGAIDQIFPHELLHVIAAQLGGPPRPGGSTQVHALGVRTDPTMAFHEGFAEHAQIMAIDDPDAAADTRALIADAATVTRASSALDDYAADMTRSWWPVGLANPNAVNLPASVLPLFGLTAQPTANNGDFVYGDHEDDGFTWRLTARYALSDDASLYANYARGRRPEVLSVSGPSAPLGAPTFNVIEAETVDSFEVGAKAALMDGRLRLDGALFHYAYDNFQTTVQEGTRFITTNAGEASAYGFEGQVFWAAADNFDLFGTYGYNHSRFEAGLYDGNRFRLSPDHMASVGAVWRLPVAGGAVEVQPSYTWQSKVFFDDNNDIPALQTQNFVADTIQDEYQDSYGLLNLRVRYAPSSGNWGVEAFGENLLDEEYIKDAGNTGDALGLPTFIAGRPASYGVAFTVRY